MSLEEMQTAWNNQTNHRTAPPEAIKCVAKAKKNFAGPALISVVALMLTLLTLATKLHRILIDPERTFGNSVWDLTYAVMGLVCALYSITYVVRFNRELRALGEDTRRCIELLVQNAREEIQSTRRDTPLLLGVFLALMILAKRESIQAGLESSSEWGFLIFVAVAFTIIWTLLYYRMNAFQLRRAQELKELQREFGAEA